MAIAFKRIARTPVPSVFAEPTPISAPVVPTVAPVVPTVAPVVPTVAPVVRVGAHLPELSGKFLLAGKALFTVTNAKGDHYVYKVRRRESVFNGKPSVGFFASVKASGGAFPFRYVGMLNPQEGTIKCTAKSEFLPGSKEYDVLSWACQAVMKSKHIPTEYHIRHAGKCGRCGRTLTDNESIERGFGPECWSRI